MVLAFLFTYVILRRLGPEAFGGVVLTQSILNLAGLGTLNLEVALMRLLPEYRQAGQWQAIRQAMVVVVGSKILLAALSAGVLYALAPIISRFYPEFDLTLAIQVGCLSLFATALTNVGKAFCLGWLRPKVRTIVLLLRRVVEIGGLLLVAAWGLTVARAVGVLAVADTFAALAFSFVAWRALRAVPTGDADAAGIRAVGRRIVGYSWPLMGSQLADVVGQNVTKLLIGRLTTPAILGFYSVARLAVDRLMLLLTQMPLMAVPVMSQDGVAADSERVYGRIGRLLQYQWALASLGNLVLWSAALLFVRLVGGTAYGPVVSALRILGLSLVFWAGTISLHVVFLLHERTTGIFVLYLVQLLTAAVGYMARASSWSTNGIALADVLAQTAVFGVAVYLVKSRFHFPIEKYLPMMGQQVGVMVLLLLPIWLLPDGWWLVGWAVFTVCVYLSFLLRSGLPDEAEWRYLDGVRIGNGRFQPYPVRLWRITRQYQKRLQMGGEN